MDKTFDLNPRSIFLWFDCAFNLNDNCVSPGGVVGDIKSVFMYHKWAWYDNALVDAYYCLLSYEKHSRSWKYVGWDRFKPI